MAETMELEKAAVPAQEPAALPPKKPKKKRKLKKWVVLGVLVLAAGLIRLQHPPGGHGKAGGLL